MRRNRRGHADGDAVGAVDQQVRKLRRQNRRLGVPLVVGRNEVDRVELQIVEHQRRDRRHAGFGVPHGGRRQAGDRAEVALLVDQHVPHVPFLGHADERGIDHAFAVRVIVTAGVAGDLRALHAAGAGREVQVVHRDQDAPLRRLEPVAHVGQRPADDDAHRVREVAVLELVFDRQIDQSAERVVSIRGRLDRIFRVVRFIAVGGQNSVLSGSQPSRQSHRKRPVFEPPGPAGNGGRESGLNIRLGDPLGNRWRQVLSVLKSIICGTHVLARFCGLARLWKMGP